MKMRSASSCCAPFMRVMKVGAGLAASDAYTCVLHDWMSSETTIFESVSW